MFLAFGECVSAVTSTESVALSYVVDVKPSSRTGSAYTYSDGISCSDRRYCATFESTQDHCSHGSEYFGSGYGRFEVKFWDQPTHFRTALAAPERCGGSVGGGGGNAPPSTEVCYEVWLVWPDGS